MLSGIGADLAHRSSVDPFAAFDKIYPDNSTDEDGDSQLHGCVMHFLSSRIQKRHRHVKFVIAVGGPGDIGRRQLG